MEYRKLIVPEKGRVACVSYPLPEPGPTELQVEIYASVISPGTERAFILNLENTSGIYPILDAGYCAAGIVTAAGRDVTGFKIGEHVATQLSHGSHGIIDQSKAYHMPGGLAFEEGAFTTLVIIAMQAVRKARIELGENVLVFGAGLVGQLAAQLAKASGANKVVVLDRVQKRLDLALTCGADGAINIEEKDWLEQLSALTDDRMPEVVIESTGFPEPIRISCEVCRKFGRVIILGSTRGDTTLNFYSLVHKKALSIIGAHLSSMPDHDSYPGNWSDFENARVCMQLLTSGKLNVRRLITETVTEADVIGAYERILGWDANMVATVIRWK